MVSKGEPLVEVQEAKPHGGFQGKALTIFLQTITLVTTGRLARHHAPCFPMPALPDARPSPCHGFPDIRRRFCPRSSP